MTCTMCGVRPARPGVRSCAPCARRRKRATRRYRDRARQSGECLFCREPARPGRRLCAAHAARHSAAVVRLRQRRMAAGLCIRCGRRRPRPDRQSCWPCAWAATRAGSAVRGRIRAGTASDADLDLWAAVHR